MRAWPTGWPRRPRIHEVNTWVWLHDVGLRAGGSVTLSEVPDAEWDALVLPGFDAVWLMGVWRRSPAGRAIALADEPLVATFRAALPDMTLDDVVGSAYCVREYVADDRLGGSSGLAAARRALADRGQRLVLDFVPNHVAVDHPWVETHPAAFVHGTVEDAERDPRSWYRAGDVVIARGRDPYFAPWEDVLQVDAFSPELRAVAVDTLASLAGQCDGVRCDMAMLLLDDVFAGTWAGRVGAPLPEPFWVEVIGAVGAAHPGFLFCAEAYWEREWDLLQQGFDLCYDKRLYDRLVDPSPAGVRAHLSADSSYLERLVRFLENHDEPRAASAFPPERYVAAAVVVTTLPGALLVHEGELDARRVRVPVFMVRRPDEPPDAERRRFVERLLAATADLREGEWAPCAVEGWPEDRSNEDLVAWSWRGPAADHLVVVNLGPADAHARVRWMPAGGHDGDRGGTVALHDLLSGDVYERDRTELAAAGLYVGLPPWGAHLLRAGA
jgi:hypothetical protein